MSKSCPPSVPVLYKSLVPGDGLLRIGELSRRSGVSPERLRAWERRYELLRPTRSPGGLRLYSEADLARVRVMRGHLEAGLAAAEAAALAKQDEVAEPAPAVALSPETLRQELADALDGYDEPRAQAVLDRVLAAMTLDAALGEVVLPYLHELGSRWERGDATVAQEHFASTVLRGRLLGLARGWGLGGGPVALLACAPGERHDLGLIAFGLALRARGWRIVFLGADTPVETTAAAGDELQPQLIVLAVVSIALPEAASPALRELARRHRLALAGPAAPEVPGALVLAGDPIAEAATITTQRLAS